PSTTFPLPLSVTVTCVKAPNTESTTDPTKPIKLTNAAVRASIVIPPPTFPSPPGGEQNLNAKTAVTVNNHAPNAPYINPSIVTPPFVPRGTFRQGAVIRNGVVADKIPSSDENVSAATAAYCTSTPMGRTLSKFGNEGPGASGEPGVGEDLDRGPRTLPACPARRGSGQGLFGMVADPGYEGA
ncbi:hypothetical protein KC342_g11682, partial [Hortaea werneckii]